MKEFFADNIKRVTLKLTSSKTLGFTIATIALYQNKLTGDQWLIAFGIFCGINVAQKLIEK